MTGRGGLATALPVFAMIAAAVVLSGCSHFRPHFAPISYDAASMEIVGPASAEVTHWYIFGMGPAGIPKDFAGDAVRRALEPHRADALVNVVADEETHYSMFWLFYRRTLRVSGLAVRFKRS